MKKLITILALLSIALLACTPSEPVAEPEIEPVEEAEEAEVEETQESVEEAEEQIITAEAQEFLDKTAKIESYSYKFGEKNQRDTFYVKGDKIKIELLNPTTNLKTERIDTVWLDTTEETAFGTCEDSKCDKTIRKTYRVVDYDAYARDLDPLSIFESVVAAELTTERKLINDRDSFELLITSGDADYSVFMDNFYGFPQEIIIGEGESEVIYQYFDVNVNDLSDEDVALSDDYEQIPNQE